MALSQDEIDKIRDTETLKSDIQKALRPAKQESKFSDFQQQIVIVVLGFFLTGGIGGGLAAMWKSLEANNQRHYLEKQRALDRAYSLISQTSKEVATTVAASDDVLVSYEPGWSAKEIEEKHNNWTKTSRDWRIKCQVLRAELPPVFPDPVIRTKFDEIMDTRRQLGRVITNLPRGKKAIETDKSLDKEIKAATELNNKIIDLLNDCIDRMTRLINNVGE
jgi:hypothetical protein